MAKIEYLIGDATVPSLEGPKIIAHICNDGGGWGRGFVVAISKRWPQPEKAFREWFRARDKNDFALGAVQFVQVADDLWIANMIGQHDMQRGSKKDPTPPIRYEALESALQKVGVEAKRLQAAVHKPRIGCGLAGGTWDRVEPIIQRTLCDQGVAAFVYDFPAAGS